MEKVTLIKNNVKRDFAPRAAKIAVEHLGWSEFYPPERPSEVFSKTKPPQILKPIQLKQPESEAIKHANEEGLYPGDNHKDVDLEKTINEISKKADDDMAKADTQPEEVRPVNDDLAVKVKRTRKTPVRSKTTKK